MIVKHASEMPAPVCSNHPRRAALDQVDWAATGPFYALCDTTCGVEVLEGNADVFVVTGQGWYPLGTVPVGSIILGCQPVDGWKVAVRRAAEVVLRPFTLDQDDERIHELIDDRFAFCQGLESTLSILSLDAVVSRSLPPRDFDVLMCGENLMRRSDVLRPIDSWLWIPYSSSVDVYSATTFGNGFGVQKERSWVGLGKNDWIQAIKSTSIHVFTTEELLDSGVLCDAWNEHFQGLLHVCRDGVLQQEEQRRSHIADAARSEAELTNGVIRANHRLASGDGSEREISDTLGPWGTAMIRALDGDGQRVGPPQSIVPALRSANSFDDVSLIGWVRIRPLKLSEGWWREPHANSFVTRHGPEKLPCTVTFKGKHPWIQLWCEDEARPLEQDDLAALDADARIVESPLPSDTKGLKQLFKFGLTGSGKDVTALLGSAVVVMALSVVTPIISGQVIGRLAEHGTAHVIVQVGAVLLVLALLTAALQTIQNHLALRIKGRMTQRVGVGVWGKLLSLPLSFFESRSPGGLGTVVLNIRIAQEAISGAAITSALGLTVALADLFVLIAVVPSVGVAVLVLLIVLTLILYRLFMRDVAAQSAYLSTQQDVSGLMLAVLSAMPKIRAAGVEHRVLARWGRVQREALRHQIVSRRVEAKVMVLTSVLMPVVIAVVVMVGGKASSEKTLLITAVVASQLLITNYIQFVSIFQILAPVIPMFGFLKPVLDEKPECGGGRAQPGELSGDIRLHDVSFRYGSDGPLVLDRISLCIKRGEFVAFVGPSGSGKSTLLRMLIGFDRPDSGSVIYDGQDLSELDVAAVRRQCGIVLQNNGTVSGAIRDNICGSGTYTDAEVWEAAEMAGVAEDIRAMPMKLSTHVASDLSGLSGGQRQRLMIARALISRPRIVIFDEATSALDNPTQAKVTESVRRLNATRIVVAHRLSTVKEADRIVVIDQGRIVESGTYDELMAMGGTFTRMADAQHSEHGTPRYA
ncbi:MAG: ATP-binding cassette domain-containing protein [Arachnia propionica]|uniref:ATP-binding cassette domain-containing protein n=1 Tax=Arachnia propionica TaxID=1750 RepID=UPI00270FD3FF|nr:ATP-binding cassette domain-containing protein [Arachnia propionica]